jgi:glycosyltransferase involved in cell wall biosynthesis
VNGGPGTPSPRGVHRQIVMAVLHPDAPGPLPKIGPLLVKALENAGWSVDETYWGSRSPDERPVHRLLSRVSELLAALGRLGRRKGAILFVNTSHTGKSLTRDIPLILGARCLGHPVVVLLHGSGPQDVRPSTMSPFSLASITMARSANAVLVLSDDERRAWERSVPKGRFFLVANPYERRFPTGPRSLHPVPTILFVGRLMKAKGVFELLQAFAELTETEPCRLSLVGDGEDGSAVLAWVREHGLSDRVDVPGYVDGPDLMQKYMDAVAFVLPSYSEGFPTVISEAMDAGLPIVTTRCRGMADRLEEGVNCLFVAPGDAHGLAAAVRRLLHDPELRDAMGKANRRRVEDFAPDVVVRDYVRVLESVRTA